MASRKCKISGCSRYSYRRSVFCLPCMKEWGREQNEKLLSEFLALHGEDAIKKYPAGFNRGSFQPHSGKSQKYRYAGRTKKLI